MLSNNLEIKPAYGSGQYNGLPIINITSEDRDLLVKHYADNLKDDLGCDLFVAMASKESLMKKNDDPEVYLSSIYKDGHIVSQAGFKEIGNDTLEKCIGRLLDQIYNRMLNGCVNWYQQQLVNQQSQCGFITNCFTRLEFLINQIDFNQNVDILDSVRNEINFFLRDPEFYLSNNYRVLKYLGSLSQSSKDLTRVFNFFIRKLSMLINQIIYLSNQLSSLPLSLPPDLEIEKQKMYQALYQAYNELILHYSYCWDVICCICNLYLVEIILTKSTLKMSDVEKYETKLREFFVDKFYAVDKKIRDVFSNKLNCYWTDYQERGLIDQFLTLNPQTIFDSQLTNLSQVPYVCEKILKEGALLKVSDN